MSGQAIGTFAGAAIGFFVGGPMGAQIGAMAGGYIGLSFDTHHTPGPRLGDIPMQTSQEGAPRPIPYGTPPPFFGNLIQAGPKIRVIVEEETGGGKGGPTYTTDHEEVYQTFAIRICEGNEDLKLLRLWYDGKLAYDAFGGTLEVDSTVAATKFTFYPGGESQLPDPSLESLPAENGGGVGNVPAYRGTGYIVFDNFNLTGWGGRIPQIQFQVSTNATITETCSEGLLAWWPLDDASPGGPARELIGGVDGLYEAFNSVGDGTVQSRPSLNLTGEAATWFDTTDRMIVNPGEFAVNTLEGWSTSVWYRLDSDAPTSGLAPLGLGYTAELTGNFGWGQYLTNLHPAGGYNDSFSLTVYEHDSPVGRGATYFQVTVYDGTNVLVYLNGNLIGSVPADEPSSESVALVQIGGGESGALKGVVQDLMLWGRALSQSEIRNMYAIGPGVYEIPDAPGTFMRGDGTTIAPCVSTAELGTVTLAYIVEDLASRVGVTSDQLDLTEDETVEVQGYLAGGSQMSAQGALAPLATAYFRDYPEYDLQIHSVPRGAATVATFTDDDFLDSDDDQRSLQQKIELPRRLNVAYSDPDSNYARRIQMAERESVNIPSTGTMEVELPLVFDADQAAQKAEIMLKVTTEESLGTLKRKLPFYRWAQLVATDRIGYDDKEWRLDKFDVLDGVIDFEAKRDRISNYTSAAVGGVALDPTAPVSSVRGPSVLQALNLPRLTTAENKPGMYLAVTGLTSAWPGADIYLSTDGGNTYVKRVTVTKRATMGYLLAGIDTDDEPVPVYVYNERTLSTVTIDQLANRANGIAFTTDDVSEVGQFQTAVEDADNEWDLTDVSRGQLGTTAASHNEGDLWVLLDQAIVFLPIDVSNAGQVMYFRAVTRGTPIENNDVITALYDPQFTDAATIDFYTDASGEKYTDASGAFYYRD